MIKRHHIQKKNDFVQFSIFLINIKYKTQALVVFAQQSFNGRSSPCSRHRGWHPLGRPHHRHVSHSHGRSSEGPFGSCSQGGSQGGHAETAIQRRRFCARVRDPGRQSGAVALAAAPAVLRWPCCCLDNKLSKQQ